MDLIRALCVAVHVWCCFLRAVLLVEENALNQENPMKRVGQKVMSWPEPRLGCRNDAGRRKRPPSWDTPQPWARDSAGREALSKIWLGSGEGGMGGSFSSWCGWL